MRSKPSLFVLCSSGRRSNWKSTRRFVLLGSRGRNSSEFPLCLCSPAIARGRSWCRSSARRRGFRRYCGTERGHIRFISGAGDCAVRPPGKLHPVQTALDECSPDSLPPFFRLVPGSLPTRVKNRGLSDRGDQPATVRVEVGTTVVFRIDHGVSVGYPRPRGGPLLFVRVFRYKEEPPRELQKDINRRRDERDNKWRRDRSARPRC